MNAKIPSPILLAKNKQVSKRTKHIDLKFHFIRSFIEENDGVQQREVFKIHSSQNTADFGTKHLDVNAFKMHEKELDDGFNILREKVYGKDGILSTTFSCRMSGDKVERNLESGITDI